MSREEFNIPIDYKWKSLYEDASSKDRGNVLRYVVRKYFCLFGQFVSDGMGKPFKTIDAPV